MSNYIIALALVAAPMAFAAFLLFFMMSGKGTKPLDENNEVSENKENTETGDGRPKNG